MKTSKWCSENINAGKTTFNMIVSEFKELINAKNIEEFKDELSDVIYMILCFIYDNTKINLPMIGASKTVKKAEERLHVWEDIFKQNNLKFNKKYLINGSNYHREDKVKMALNLAKQDLHK